VLAFVKIVAAPLCRGVLAFVPKKHGDTAPWLVSSLVLPKLFEPRIAKRFEAGAEEDRAVAQAIKLGSRLAPASHLRLVKPNRIQRKIYPTKSAHTSLSPMPDVLQKPDASKERPITKTPKNERKK
jgi:hypothetical protein